MASLVRLCYTAHDIRVLHSAQILEAEKQSTLQIKQETGFKLCLAPSVLTVLQRLTDWYVHQIQVEMRGFPGFMLLLDSCLRKSLSPSNAGPERIKKSDKIKFTLSLRGRGEL